MHREEEHLAFNNTVKKNSLIKLVSLDPNQKGNRVFIHI